MSDSDPTSPQMSDYSVISSMDILSISESQSSRRSSILSHLSSAENAQPVPDSLRWSELVIPSLEIIQSISATGGMALIGSREEGSRGRESLGPTSVSGSEAESEIILVQSTGRLRLSDTEGDVSSLDDCGSSNGQGMISSGVLVDHPPGSGRSSRSSRRKTKAIPNITTTSTLSKSSQNPTDFSVRAENDPNTPKAFKPKGIQKKETGVGCRMDTGTENGGKKKRPTRRGGRRIIARRENARAANIVDDLLLDDHNGKDDLDLEATPRKATPIFGIAGSSRKVNSGSQIRIPAESSSKFGSGTARRQDSGIFRNEVGYEDGGDDGDGEDTISEYSEDGASRCLDLDDLDLGEDEDEVDTGEDDDDDDEGQVELMEVLGHLSLEDDRSVMSTEDARSSIDRSSLHDPSSFSFFNDTDEFVSVKANKLRLWQALCIELGLVDLEGSSEGLPDLPEDRSRSRSIRPTARPSTLSEVSTKSQPRSRSRSRSRSITPKPINRLPRLPQSLTQASKLLHERAHVNLVDYFEARQGQGQGQGQGQVRDQGVESGGKTAASTSISTSATSSSPSSSLGAPSQEPKLGSKIEPPSATKRTTVPSPRSTDKSDNELVSRPAVQISDTTKPAVAAIAHGYGTYAHLVHPSVSAMRKYTKSHKKLVKLDTVKMEWLDPLLRDFGYKRARVRATATAGARVGDP